MLTRILAVAAAGSMLWLAGGCRSSATSEAAKPYEQAARRIQAGGTYYKISNPVRLFASLERLFHGLELSLASPDSQLPPEFVRELQQFSAAFALAWKLAGVDELAACGASSVPLEGESGLFENRMFLALPREPQGFLWGLTGSGNRPLREEFRALPADTVFAADLTLEPVALARTLKRLETISRQGDELADSIFKTPLEPLLAGISGEWSVLVTADGDASADTLEGIRLLVTLPDAGGRLFRYLAGVAQLVPGTVSGENRVVFGPLNRFGISWRPELHFDDGRLYLYSSQDMLDYLADESAPRLADTPEFRKLAAGLPESGSGFLYSGGGLALLRNELASLTGAESAAALAELDQQELTVFRNEPDGKLTVSCSNWDLNQVEFAERALIPAVGLITLVSPYLTEHREMLDDKAAQQKCRLQLKPLADALEKYAAEHDGRFPAEEGIAGLKTLLEAGLIAPSALICPGTEDEAAADTESFTFDNCSYVYFGGFNRKSNPKLPLVIDWPFNHADAVNVILVDGSVETLELENPENCRRVVSYLHTRYHYTEPEFKQLMQKAAALDQQFELD